MISRFLAAPSACAAAVFAVGLAAVPATAAADAARDAAGSFRIGELRGLQVHDAPAPAAPIRFADMANGGAEIGLDAFAGEVLLVNFWATWCAPCLHEMPSIDRLAATLSEEGLDGRVRVLTVNFDRGDGTRPARWLVDNEITRLPLYHDADMSSGRDAGLRGMPTTLVIDAEGREVARLEGAAEWDAAEVVALLRAVADAAADADPT